MLARSKLTNRKTQVAAADLRGIGIGSNIRLLREALSRGRGREREGEGEKDTAESKQGKSNETGGSEQERYSF